MTFCLPPAPGPVVITSSPPSFFKISITWDPPEIRNGIIITYEVSYRPSSAPQIITTMNTTDLETSFTTESRLALGTAYIFTVTAFTGAGRGENVTASISTLARPRKIRALCLTSTHTGIQYSYDISQSVHVRVLPFSHSCSKRSGGGNTQCHSSHCIMECPGHPRLLHRPLHCALQSSGVSASQETVWNNSVSIKCHIWCDCWSGLNSHLPVSGLCHWHTQWYIIGGRDKYSF